MTTTIDLRPEHDETDNQGPNPACGPFACCAALDCIWERATDQQTRFDPLHLWNWSRWHMGMAGVSIGSTFDSLERSTRLNGMRLNGDVLMGFRLARTQVADTRYAELKHLLSMGVPVVWEMKVTPDLHALSDKRDWRTHTISADTSNTLGQHYVCIVGFDDDCQRWLVENSWGSEWGDGGFFGVPYSSLQSLTESLQHFNELPIYPKPVDGYTMQAALTTMERAAFSDRAKDQLLKTLMTAYGGGDAQALLDACVLWGVSDKHMEALSGWPRGTVREFKQNMPNLNWTGFIWDQL